MKKIISLLLCALLLASAVLSGCSGDVMDSRKAEASKDKYRNFYEIFTQSYCDSDGDAIGDLQGIISQLDYLNDGDPNTGEDLGIDGIWLTPIMPSHSYHKYDVENYYDIDPAFGTLETFDTLVGECHKRGIKLIQLGFFVNIGEFFVPYFLSGNLMDDWDRFPIANGL